MAGRAILVVAIILVLSPMIGAQATRPAINSSDPRVEMRANQAFNRGEFSTALPLFQALAQAAKSEPSRLGAIQEKIRVCQKALDALKIASSAQPDPQAGDIPIDAETRKKHAPPKPGEVLDMTIKE